MEDETKDISQRYTNALGTMYVTKGSDTTGMKQIITWEVIKFCSGERCPAFALCGYEKVGKCKVEGTYLRSIAQILHRNFIDVLDEPTLTRVGMHLMPIYQNLCRLKISELGVDNPGEADDNGRALINPVYTEIWEHIKLLEQTWRSLGLSDYYVEAEMGGEPDLGEEEEVLSKEEVPVKEKIKLRKR